MGVGDPSSGTKVQITERGQRHLGTALGPWDFAEDYASKKVCNWVTEVSTLANTAATRSHVVYCAFMHGMIGRWTYIMRTIPDISHLFQPLEDAIHLKLILSLTGDSACSALE